MALPAHLRYVLYYFMMIGMVAVLPLGGPDRQKRGITSMGRVIWTVAAILVAIWVFFAVVRALGALVHLALIVAVILVAYTLFSGLRNRSRSAE